jgi:hypothetical protein
VAALEAGGIGRGAAVVADQQRGAEHWPSPFCASGLYGRDDETF